MSDTDLDLFRIYDHADPGTGYPPKWDRLPGEDYGIKDIVRREAGNRCIRCGHPYAKGMGEWSRCDDQCKHASGNVRYQDWRLYDQAISSTDGAAYVVENEGWTEQNITSAAAAELIAEGHVVEAQWRILTVHHLDGVKLNLRWWNLVALCQRCHLTIQGKVYLDREFIRAHSPWFRIYAAGWYAWKYEGRYITRTEAERRLDELLAYEFRQPSLI